MTSANPRPASVVIQRRVEWADTDAAGHYHHTALVRWAEAAEAVLAYRLGVSRLFGVTPRVRYEAEYLAPLYFGDVVDIELRVADVGRASIRFGFEARCGEQVAARGEVVAVHVDPKAERGKRAALPWSPEVRKVLTESGPQRPELLSR